MKISLICRVVLCWLCLFTLGWSQSFSSSAQLLSQLNKASQTAGIQVGLVIDARDDDPVHYELVTLDSSGTVYDVLSQSKISKVYHPQYSKPPKVMIYSLMNKAQDNTVEGDRFWAFFRWDNRQWILLETLGIAEATVKDGDLVGFVRTPWVKESGQWKPKYKPVSPVK